MPRIVFLNRFYWPDVAATAQQLTDLAEDLAQSGWDVTVLAGSGSYTKEGRSDLRHAEERNGVHIRRVRATQMGRRNVFGRALDYLSYHLAATWRLLVMPRPDVVVAMSDPPFILAPVVLIGAVRGYRTVYYLQDLYPQVARALGVFRDGPLYRLLVRLARWLHARCDAIVVLSDQMARRVVALGAAPGRVVTVGHWADTTRITPVPPARNWFLGRHGFEGKFVVLYSGNAGRGHLLDPVLGAARFFRDDPDVVFLFIGGGNQFPGLRAAVEAEGLPNVRILPYLPREHLRYSLSAADISLVTEKPEVSGLLLPCKIYGILASGRPLIFLGAATSEVAGLIRENDCGVVVQHDDARKLHDAIQYLRGDAREAARLGANGRRAAVQRYDRAAATRLWIDQVVRLVGTDARYRAPSDRVAGVVE